MTDRECIALLTDGMCQPQSSAATYKAVRKTNSTSIATKIVAMVLIVCTVVFIGITAILNHQTNKAVNEANAILSSASEEAEEKVAEAKSNAEKNIAEAKAKAKKIKE